MRALTAIVHGQVLIDPSEATSPGAAPASGPGPGSASASGASRASSQPRDLLVGGGQILAVTEAGGLDWLLAGPGPSSGSAPGSSGPSSGSAPGSSGPSSGSAPGSSGPVEVVDARGLTLLPGLVDSHVHLTGGGGESGFRSRVPRQQLSGLVTAGVTTAVGVLGTDGVTRTMRELVATTLALREEGLSAYCFTGNYAVPVVTLTGSVRDDIVFCDPVLGVGELAISDHRSSQPTFDELLRIASDAYVAGLTAGKAGLLHLHLGDGARGLSLIARALAESELPARVFQPTHLNRNRRLLAEAQALCAARAEAGLPQPWYDLTAFPAEDCDGDTTSAADAALGWWRAGLPLDCLTISSDGGGCLPVFDAHGCMTRMGVGRATTLLETLRALVAGGLPLALAGPLLSRNPARALMLRGKGSLAVGADADLIAVDADLSLQAVMARGRFLLRDGALLPEGRGVFEKEEP